MSAVALILVISAHITAAQNAPDLPDDFGGSGEVAAVVDDTQQVPAESAPTVVPDASPVIERYLVSELWCPHCPAAKAAFIASGGKPKNIISVAQARAMGQVVTSIPFEFTATLPAQQSVPAKAMPIRYIQWPGWGTIDLATYSRNCNCSMCVSIRAKQQEYQRQVREYNQSRYTPESIKASQEPTEDAVVADLVEQMALSPLDVVADLGSGHDARIAVALTRRYRCRVIGVEIDPVAAENSRKAIQKADLQDRITIITGDALQFDLTKHGVTAVAAYLYPPLLEKLSPKLKRVRIVATPFHQVPGLAMIEKRSVWIYRRSGT